jgi:hypothetical protein
MLSSWNEMKKHRVLVVCPQKSGSHLICELMANLSYRVLGSVNRDQEARFEPSELASMAQLCLRAHERVVFRVARSLGFLRGFEPLAVSLLSASWAERFGVPLASRYELRIVHALHSRPGLAALSRLPFESLPPNICVMTHELPMGKCDGALLRAWAKTGEPAIVFAYRDPRAVLCSFVNYLTGRTSRKRHGGFAEYDVYQEILANIPSDEERLMHAILDPGFPGHNDFGECLWLLRHPRVCKVRYEELAGAAGGGSDEARNAAVERILAHLGMQADPQSMSQGIYRKDSFTFCRGQINSWKEMFKPEHHRAFESRFGDILRLYGYPPFADPQAFQGTL